MVTQTRNQTFHKVDWVTKQKEEEEMVNSIDFQPVSISDD